MMVTIGKGPTRGVNLGNARTSVLDVRRAATGMQGVKGGFERRLHGTVPVVPKLDEDGGVAGDPTLDFRRQEQMHRRLSTLARTLGKDFSMKLEPGGWWAYHFDSNKITYPVKDMLKRNDRSNMGVICHELAHRLYSRLPKDDRIKNPAFHFLWNSLEDIRINRIISRRYAGVPIMMKELYRDFLDLEKRQEQYDKFAAQGKTVPKSKQFGFAA
ncbi:MAG: hypothetical protein RL846_34805, partial [Deltaproteobacteria bacterium]